MWVQVQLHRGAAGYREPRVRPARQPDPNRGQRGAGGNTRHDTGHTGLA